MRLLDSNLLSCKSYIPSFDLISSALELHSLQPGVESVPIRIELEDIYLERKFRTFVSETICESTYTPEDYRISILDTICDPTGVIELKVEVCREDRLPADTLSLDFYLESPLAQEDGPFSEQDIIFLQGQNCVQRTFFMQGNGIHVLLNGDAESRRPYTLKKTFFDAHEKMEYDYTNNMVYVEVCKNMVSVDQSIKEHVTLDVYPNPTDAYVTLSSTVLKIKTVKVYDQRGTLHHNLSSDVHEVKISFVGLVEGIYFLHIEDESGQRHIEKVVFMK